MQDFHQQNSALSLAALLSAVDVLSLHSHWICALAKSCLVVYRSPDHPPTGSLVAVSSVESSALGGSCEDTKETFLHNLHKG